MLINGNVLDRKISAVKKNTDVLVISNKEIGLRVNADKSAWSCLNAVRIHIVEIDNNSLKVLKSSDICEQRQQVRILSRKKLRAD